MEFYPQGGDSGLGLPFWIRFNVHVVSNFALFNLNTVSYEDNLLLLSMAKKP